MTPGKRVTLADVLVAVAGGAGSAAEIARRTGADLDTAETALTTLAASGRVRRALVFAGGCASDGCGPCGSAGGCASAGVGSLVGSGLTEWRIVER